MNIHGNFCGALENCKKCESLAQRIFPRLRYSVINLPTYAHGFSIIYLLYA